MTSSKKTFLYILIILIPIIVTFLLISTVLHSSLSNFSPSWSDEIDYWIQIQSFKEVGFKSGYFSVNELISNSSFSHYGTHGPMFPVLFGSLARIFGWKNYSGPVFNLVLLCSSLAFFLWLTKPDLKKSLFILIILLFSYQLFLYIPSLMQESINFVFAILFCALFIRIHVLKDHNKFLLTGILCIVFIASLFRILWLLAAFPVFWSIYKEMRGNHKKTAFIIAATLLYVSLSVFLYFYWTSAYPGGFLFKLTHAKPGLSMIELVFAQLMMNIKKLFGLNMVYHKSEFVARYLYILVIILLLFKVKKERDVILSTLFILLSTLLTTLLLYDIGNFRILAPFLLFALLVIVFLFDARFLWKIMVVYTVVNIFTIGFFISNYRDILADHFSSSFSVPDNENDSEFSHLQYFSNSNTWCNSLVSTRVYSKDFMQLTPGIGLNILYDLQDTGSPLQSHYLLVPYEVLATEGIVSTCEIIKKYDNGDILCERINDGCL